MVKINRSGYGCSVGKVNIGAVAYADDICLLSGSSYGLQQLLHICSTFAVERQLMFNSSKTKCIRFVSGKTSWMSPLPLPVLILGGKNLDFVQSWKHLGHIMCFDMKESLSIEFEMKRFFSSFNSFYHQFKGATPIVLCRLLQAFSSVFYGCQLWCCGDSQLHKLRVAWNDAIRKICNVRRGCHVDNMLYSNGLLPLPELLRKRKLQFLSSLNRSDNGVISYISPNSFQLSFFTSCREWELHYCQSHTRVLSRCSIAQDIWENVDLSLSVSRREAANLAYSWLFEPARSSKSVLQDLFSVD